LQVTKQLTYTVTWASLIVLVRKKDGSCCFCVDNCCLNECTAKDDYPLPRVEDNLEAMQGSIWFSSLNLQSGHWQVEMEEIDKAKTAFTTNIMLWELNVMPFGLCNAPTAFQPSVRDAVLPAKSGILTISGSKFYSTDC